MVQEHRAHTKSFGQNCTNTAKHVNKIGADMYKTHPIPVFKCIQFELYALKTKAKEQWTIQ